MSRVFGGSCDLRPETSQQVGIAAIEGNPPDPQSHPLTVLVKGAPSVPPRCLSRVRSAVGSRRYRVCSRTRNSGVATKHEVTAPRWKHAASRRQAPRTFSELLDDDAADGAVARRRAGPRLIDAGHQRLSASRRAPVAACGACVLSGGGLPGRLAGVVAGALRLSLGLPGAGLKPGPGLL